MWRALFGFLFKALASAGAFFMVKGSGRTAQRLDDAQKALQGEQRRNEIDENVARMSDADLDRILRESERYDL